MAFFQELKRRKVFRVTSVYAVTAWGASLGAAELLPTFGLPDESVRWFVIAAFGFLPVVALLAWLYELTPNGIERDPADIESTDRRSESAATQSAPQKPVPELIATWAGEQRSFRQTFTIGRDEICELCIDDPKISRTHVQIVAQNGAWYIEDLGSSNGTSLNGELVTRAKLPAKSHITLYEGGIELTLAVVAKNGATTTILAGPQNN